MSIKFIITILIHQADDFNYLQSEWISFQIPVKTRLHAEGWHVFNSNVNLYRKSRNVNLRKSPISGESEEILLRLMFNSVTDSFNSTKLEKKNKQKYVKTISLNV